MKPNYDDLTPAQKAKFTRLANKLDDQRHAAYQIQWETYSKKSTTLSAEIEPQIEAIRLEAQQKVEALRQQIKEITDTASNEVWELRKQVSAECAPEFKAYEEASSRAFKWRNEKWEEVKANFWKELGYTVEEEKKTA
jgi:hypothetical protein